MTTVDATAADRPPPRAGLPTLVKVLLIVGAVVGVLAGLVALLVWSVLALTAPPVKAAEAFLAATAASGPAVSYTMASPGFRSAASEAQWVAYAQRHGLAGYTGASWSSRNVTNTVAVLQGSLKIGGGATPATVQLTRSAAGWQVLRLDLAAGGVSAGSASDMDATPTDAETAADAASNTNGATSAPEGAQGAPVVVPPPAAQSTRQIPGAMLSGLCRQVLAQQAHAALDSIECPDALPTRPNATTACMVRKGGQSALMTARLETFDPATGRFTVDCKVADHPL